MSDIQLPIPLDKIADIQLKKRWFSQRVLLIDEQGSSYQLPRCSSEQIQNLKNQLEHQQAQKRVYNRLEQLLNGGSSLESLLLQSLEKKSPTAVIEAINLLVEVALQRQASDIHLTPFSSHLQIQFRIHGFIETVADLPLEYQPFLMVRLKVLGKMAVYRQDIPQEGQSVWRSGIELRLSLMPSIDGEKAAIRIFNQALLLDLNELGFSPERQQQLKGMMTSGLFIVTGPCGSGKTTTLYALLRELQKQRPGLHMMTIEEPVEQRLEGITQVEVSETRGLTFAQGLKHLLRQDPNMIMVGEIRDAETARVAIQAGMTGHIVLSSMHTGSCTEAITRLLDMGLEPYQVASALTGVLNQRLIRLNCFCQGESKCTKCLGTGILGREAICELLTIDEVMRQAILQKVDTASLKSAFLSDENSLRQDGLARIDEGRLSLLELERVL